MLPSVAGFLMHGKCCKMAVIFASATAPCATLVTTLKMAGGESFRSAVSILAVQVERLRQYSSGHRTSEELGR